MNQRINNLQKKIDAVLKLTKWFLILACYYWSFIFLMLISHSIFNWELIYFACRVTELQKSFWFYVVSFYIDTERDTMWYDNPIVVIRSMRCCNSCLGLPLFDHFYDNVLSCLFFETSIFYYCIIDKKYCMA